MILTALNNYYQRLAAQDKVPSFGFSSQKISYVLIFSMNGEPLQIADIRDATGKKPRPTLVPVPFDKGRASGIHAYPLWDKTAYAFGVAADGGERTGKEHAAFVVRQKELFGVSDDPSLIAFLTLLDTWQLSKLEILPGYSADVLDANFVFRLDGRREYLHDNAAAKAIWRQTLEGDVEAEGQCLITGETGPLGRSHPKIKEVNGAQQAGASLVSFNEKAYESYGNKGQANASISRLAIFGYSTALNHLLRRSDHNHQRLQMGDATAVFWAEAPDAKQAEAAESFFAAAYDSPTDEQEAARLETVLDGMAQGRPLESLDPELHAETKFYVLGLAPNAARLSVRFWYASDLGQVVRHYADHRRDLMLDPVPWKGVAPAMWRLLYATAPSRDGKSKAEDVPPQLAGEVTRAILTGSRYPRSLLANTIMRMRNDGDISGIRVALCKAVLVREARLGVYAPSHFQEGIPVSLDRQSTQPAYLLGRLFAELENAQRAALGKNLNATIRDRYYGAASATPASIFPMLLRNVQHHLSNMRKKDKGGLAHTIEGEIAGIVDGLGEQFPKSLRIEDQGRFAIGYYHQSSVRFAKNTSTKNNSPQPEGE